MRAAAVEKPAAPERRCCATPGARNCLDDVESAGGHPPRSSQRRATIDLHTHGMMGNHGCADGRPTTAECSFPSAIDSMDT
eukprot:8349131-Pyramimonas_sp.AAC.1